MPAVDWDNLTTEDFWAMPCVCGHRRDQHQRACMCGACDLPCLERDCKCKVFVFGPEWIEDQLEDFGRDEAYWRVAFEKNYGFTIR